MKSKELLMDHNDCIFCKIVKGEIPSKKVYEDDHVLAFEDIAPLAKKHVLFISKGHSSDINDMMENDPEMVGKLFQAITTFSKESGYFDYGYRVVSNIGRTAGQSVFHTHFHVLSGEKLGRFGS
jgi:histidine triad (HIT) family protein